MSGEVLAGDDCHHESTHDCSCSPERKTNVGRVGCRMVGGSQGSRAIWRLRQSDGVCKRRVVSAVLRSLYGLTAAIPKTSNSHQTMPHAGRLGEIGKRWWPWRLCGSPLAVYGRWKQLGVPLKSIARSVVPGTTQSASTVAEQSGIAAIAKGLIERMC